MTGIGINLDDLGIGTGPAVPVPAITYPTDLEQYDFTLHRLALGSWREVRDCLLYEAKVRIGRNLPLWFLLHWVETESECEASIKERLTLLRYPRAYREVFDDHICSYEDDPNAEPHPDRPVPARWEHMPSREPTQDDGPSVSADALHLLLDRLPHYLEPVCIRLLGNRHLDASLVRAICELLLKDAPWRLIYVAGARAALPTDVIESITNAEGLHAHYAQERLVNRERLDPQTLPALIGKCDRESILAHPDCTQAARDEIERLGLSDSVLSHTERRNALEALERARRNLASGYLDRPGRSFGPKERLIADAVRANPEIGLYEINTVITTNDPEDDDF